LLDFALADRLIDELERACAASSAALTAWSEGKSPQQTEQKGAA